ncbi:MAG: ParB N-terminal domain-containing protein [Lachnospiraceae bacterium]|nr:ParB N-terminal domain-containing protein [Lachnospiraceae bacterium]
MYNGSYGVVTDRNGLYYMRARYYNPDIKRFINQDIKVGDIGSSQSLNRYAYCEGNPVSLIDPFGLSPEGTQDKGKESKYQWLHNVLDFAGIVFDGADLINALIYAAEKDYVNAAISLACGIPAVGTVVAGVAKGTKAVKAIKAAAKITEACKTVAKVGNVAAGVKASYDTYTEAKQKGYSTGEALAYMAGTAVAGYVTGKAASWAAGKVANFASTNLPKLASSAKETAGRFVSRVKGAFQGGGSSGGGRKKINRGFAINPFYKGGSNLSKAIEGTSYDINKMKRTQPYVFQNTVEQYKKQIITEGPNFIEPIPVRVHNGEALIVDGHHRFEAFRQLGYDRVPIKYIHKSQLGKTLEDGTYVRNLQELLDGRLAN